MSSIDCCSGARKADLGEETFELAEAFADFEAIVGREVVKREREERLHIYEFWVVELVRLCRTLLHQTGEVYIEKQ